MPKELASMLNQPLKIGGRTVSKRTAMAPMTNLGHAAFRELISEFGGYGLLFTEMGSAKTIPNENQRFSDYFKWRPNELSTLVCQILGSDPLTMALAAERIEKEGFFGVDINFGCATGHICRRNLGAALLKHPSLAVKIVSQVKQAVSIPVFAKFRTGWTDDPRPAVDLARRFEDAGVDALTFHPRVAPDRRTRPPKWEYIRQVKQAVSIPVFGNGNVIDAGDCCRILHETGCDAVSVGRMTIAKPWLFAEWTADSKYGASIYPQTAFRLVELLRHHFEPAKALRRFKKFSAYYSANFRFGHQLYIKLKNAADLKAAEDILHHFFSGPCELNNRPNMNLFF